MVLKIYFKIYQIYVVYVKDLNFVGKGYVTFPTTKHNLSVKRYGSNINV